MTDAAGTVRARYAYDPYGRRTKLSGDVDADFGFAGMFWASEANLYLTHFRAYDPNLGRWLSRDPLPNAERAQAPNLYGYVGNDPIDYIDPKGLFPTTMDLCVKEAGLCATLAGAGTAGGGAIAAAVEEGAPAAAAAAPEAESCAAAFADTAVPQALPPADTALSIQALVRGTRILIAPDYELVGLYYQLPATVAFVDENGQEILGNELDILTENLGWAQQYFEASFKDLAQSGLSPFERMMELGRILERSALIRGSNLF